MSKTTTNNVIDHTSDAGFRAWVSEHITTLTGLGATQTADTGQINTATVTRPGTNTTAGYALLSTGLLVYKFEFGTGSSATAPRILVTVGTGSNGSGTITGQTNTASVDMTVGSAPSSTSTNYLSAWCVNNGYIGISWKESGNSSLLPMGLLICGPTVDSTQTPTSTGFGVLRKTSGAISIQSVRTAATAVTMTDTALGGAGGANPYAFTCIVGNVSSSIDSSGNNQAYPCMINVKDVQRWLWCVSIIASEAAVGVTFSVAIIGTTTRTYRAVNNGSVNLSPTGLSTHGLAMLWE